MNDLTKEQKEDVDNRVSEFKKRHTALSEELKVDWGAFIHKVQVDPQNGFYVDKIVMVPVDTKYQPVPSPLQKDVLLK